MRLLPYNWLRPFCRTSFAIRYLLIIYHYVLCVVSYWQHCQIDYEETIQPQILRFKTEYSLKHGGLKQNTASNTEV